MVASTLTLLGSMAFVVDVGFLYAAHADLQHGLDAAALAGVGYFDGTPEGITLAKQKAMHFASLNQVLGRKLVLPEEAIVVGVVEEGVFAPSDDVQAIHAMSIDHEVVDLPVYFAGVAFGVDSMSAGRTSQAARTPDQPAGETGCHLPIAVPDCILDHIDLYQAVEYRLNALLPDSIGWASIHGEPTPQQVSDGMTDACGEGDAETGMRVYLNDDTMNAALAHLADVLNGDSSAETTPWEATKWGPMPPRPAGSAVHAANYGRSVLQGPIITFQSGSGRCLIDTKFDDSMPITGFTWAVIYDVDLAGPDKGVRVKLDLENTYEVGAGLGGHPASNLKVPGNAVLIR